ncbi:unnamed protein product [Acanthocheilonema viteae]|uniref:Uncharacterized protein n=1 Tax=Acanthocheilonema viteae TaxID=6277 RepID=A0A498SJI1_ACAVI|nr:unnamed protein product [Acanthocheilonema viteae]
MPYARRFNGDGLEASTSLELLSFDKASTQRDYKPIVSLLTHLSHLRTTPCYFILHDDRTSSCTYGFIVYVRSPSGSIYADNDQ